MAGISNAAAALTDPAPIQLRKTVPARIVGMRAAKPAKTAQSGRAAKLATAAVTGLFSAVLCTPPYALARSGIACQARGGAGLHEQPGGRDARRNG